MEGRLLTLFELQCEEHLLYAAEREACAPALAQLREDKQSLSLHLGAYHLLRLLVMLVVCVDTGAEAGRGRRASGSAVDAETAAAVREMQGALDAFLPLLDEQAHVLFY
ncbi:hypothetical protein B484DRAFT_399300 [Ochromonadaceae sp. CCMP2298]|nr:hypothetical protein B484DRAFT_399300 [Ochromonadaceae sp. CCMP2298]